MKRQARAICALAALGRGGGGGIASAWSPSASATRVRTRARAAAAAPPPRSSSSARALLLPLRSTPDPNDPCWQDNYDADDDCLSTVYSAAFVAEDWIKSMPCGEGADCLPENLSHPGTMGDSGVEKVDVMEYLNIRKAAPVSEKSGKKDAGA